MKITIATGGSGGHIFPALYVARELKKKGHTIYLMGALTKVAKKIESEGFSCIAFSGRGLTFRSPFELIAVLFSMMKAVINSFLELLKIKPDVVCGFGGYGAFAVVFSARCLGIPTMIHEQNVLLGKANRVLAKCVKKVAISFEKTRQYLRNRHVVLTGCPSHISLENISKDALYSRFQLSKNKFTFLILGGSQGSHRINVEFLEVIKLLKTGFDFQVIHVTGDKDFDSIKNSYRDLKVGAYVVPFLENIEEAYGIADLAISRAGAVTVTELALFGVAAILIPYPYAQSHQRENALVLTETGTAETIEEKDLSTEKLKDIILKFVRNRLSSDEIRACFKNVIVRDASLNVAEEIVSLKEGR